METQVHERKRMFMNVLNSKFMNERQAKLSVHERNSEFMNEMNIHAEVHDVHRYMCYIWHTRVADSESERAKSQNFLEGKIVIRVHLCRVRFCRCGAARVLRAGSSSLRATAAGALPFPLITATFDATIGRRDPRIPSSGPPPPPPSD